MSALSTAQLNTILEVRRREVTSDEMGGQEVEWVTVDHLPGRVSSPPTSTTNATLTAAQSLERVPYYVYFQPGVDVRRGDVLIDTSDDRKLWVEAVTRPSIAAYFRAGCREWQAEPTVEAP